MGDRRKRKRLSSLRRIIIEHRRKIHSELKSTSPNTALIAYWSKEIENWEKQVEQTERQLTKHRRKRKPE
jgi:hypothetical protein